MYKKILIPVDGSEHSVLACESAIAIAKGGGGGEEIVLLSCYEVRSARIGASSAKGEIVNELEAEGKKTLAPYELLCMKAGVNYKAMVERGKPADTIVHIAKQEDCDLIVMGSRGLGKLVGAVLGSVTTTVLKDTPVPVLVVKKKAK